MYDVAVLTLNESVSFNDSVRPVCLPERPKLDVNKYKGHFVTVTGWGYHKPDEQNDILVHAPLRIFSKK